MKYFDFTIAINSDKTVKFRFDENEFKSSELLMDDEKTIDDFIHMINDPGATIQNGHTKDIGKKIKNMLLPPNSDIEEEFKKAIDYVHNQNRDKGKKYGLRILLNLDEAGQKFLNYPWEIMVYNDQFLSTDSETPIVRILNGANQKIELEGAKRQLLALYSNVVGEYVVDTAGESEIISRWCDEHHDIVKSDQIMDGVTIRKFMNKLLGNAFNIIHFVGHGEFYETTKTGVIAFRSDKEGVPLEKVKHDDFLQMLTNQKRLGLVILNSCNTSVMARSVTSNFVGFVPSLLKKIPAVIAMNRPITSEAALSFVDGLYSQIFNTQIEEAISIARSNMINPRCSAIDFCIPTLYLAHQDGKPVKEIFHSGLDSLYVDLKYINVNPLATRRIFDTYWEEMITPYAGIDFDNIKTISKVKLFWEPRHVKVIHLFDQLIDEIIKSKGKPDLKNHQITTSFIETLNSLKTSLEKADYKEFDNIRDKIKNEKINLDKLIDAMFLGRGEDTN